MTVFNSIGVLGAGTMGSGIAARIAVGGRRVVLVDTKPEFIDRSLEEIRKLLDARKTAFSQIYPESTDEIMSRIHGTCDSGPLKDLPFVLECITEDIESKHDTLKYLGELCRDTTVFGTSVTSTTVEKLTEGLSCSGRTVGFHFFWERGELPLAELILSESTSPRAAHVADRAARAMDAVVIHSDDAPGFIVKRMQSAIFAESVRMLNEGGTTIPTIDAAANEALGIDGPFAVMNDRGIGFAEFSAQGLVGRLPDLYVPPERLRAQASSGEPWPITGEVDPDKKAALIDRFSGLALWVAASMFDEEIGSAEDINWGMRYGLGFSTGPFDMFNRMGPERATALVCDFAKLRNLSMPDAIQSFSNKTGKWPLSYVLTEVEGDIAWITARRPDTQNALDETLISQLETALKKVEKNDAVRIVLFSGMGGVLVSGPPRELFVDKLGNNDVEGILALHRRIQSLFTKVAESPKTTVARTRGITEGAGFEFALACRYLVASPRAFFLFPETGLGMHPALGGTQRLPRKVGKSIGKYVIMTGDLLTAEAAERLGIADAVVDDDDTAPILVADLDGARSLSDDEIGPSDDELAAISLFNGAQCARTLKGDTPSENKVAARIANVLASKAPAAIILVNKLIDDGLALEIPKALQFELSSFKLILGTKDALVGLKSNDDAPPVFTGE